MDRTEFWDLVESAREADEPTGEALTALLDGRPLDDLVAFQRELDAVTGGLHRWDVWGAAYLIGGGCSDDSFTDFKAGLVGLGRDWLERVAVAPDDLAEHPLVRESAEAGDDGEQLFDEELGSAAATAAEDADLDEDFWEALDALPDDGGETEMGESWDFDDAAEMRARLPRLAEMFLPSWK